VMALHVRRSYYNQFFGRQPDDERPLTGINTRQIYKSSRLVSNLTGMMVQPNKAIVGANAFSHESGIHQDGVLKHRQTYEIMDAQLIGLQDNQIVLGKLSGRAALKNRLEELGFELSHEEMDRAFTRFKDLADKKREVSDRDLEAIVNDELRLESIGQLLYSLERVQVSCGDHEVPTATVSLKTQEGKLLTEAATGTGPVDAVYKCINRIVAMPGVLTEYGLQSVTGGIDAQANVALRVEYRGRIFSGNAANTDIIVASTQAYINAMNKVLMSREFRLHAQHDELENQDAELEAVSL